MPRPTTLYNTFFHPFIYYAHVNHVLYIYIQHLTSNLQSSLHFIFRIVVNVTNFYEGVSSIFDIHFATRITIEYGCSDVPFPTRKPTYNNVAHINLYYCYSP